MKITIEFDNDKLPAPFRLEGSEGAAGMSNILAFLHEQLLLNAREKAIEEGCKAPYVEAFFDKQQGEGAGKKWVEAIKMHAEANVELAKLLLDNMKVVIDIAKLKKMTAEAVERGRLAAEEAEKRRLEKEERKRKAAERKAQKST